MHKKLILLFFIGFSTCFCFGQFVFDREDYYLPRRTSINNNYNPPLTIHFKDNLFIDVAPVDNLMYLEFLHSVAYFWDENISEKIKNLPAHGLNMSLMKIKFDGMTVSSDFIKRQNLNVDLKTGKNFISDDFIRHPSYTYYPLVNITRKQAEMYCKWRTDMLKIINAYFSKNLKQRKKRPKTINCRLPTKSELNEALLVFGLSEKKLKKNILIPFIRYQSHYKKKYKKAYFLKDNITEITSDSTLFGGNWKNSSDSKLPNDYTGFRCICEVTPY